MNPLKDIIDLGLKHVKNQFNRISKDVVDYYNSRPSDKTDTVITILNEIELAKESLEGYFQFLTDVDNPEVQALFREASFIEKLIQERDALLVKINNCSDFLTKVEAGIISKDAVRGGDQALDLLALQYTHMVNYFEVLNKRINLYI